MKKGTFSGPCPSCLKTAWQEIFCGRIRDGSSGKLTSKKVAVIQCQNCHLARLEKFALALEDYQSPSYRHSYNDTIYPEQLLSMHDHEQARRLDLLGGEKVRGKVILDFGCGHGSFLDFVKGLAKQTVGIEPFSGLHSSLKQRGHEVFPSGKEALKKLAGKVDIVTSFGVIEHVEDPNEHLATAEKLLKKGGRLLVQTDNLDDILMKTEAKDFPPFFFRTAHNWYFTMDSLEQMLPKGFQLERKTSNHYYDFSNFLLWHKAGKPTGLGKLSLFDETFNALWKATLEKSGLGELISVFAVKR